MPSTIERRTCSGIAGSIPRPGWRRTPRNATASGTSAIAGDRDQPVVGHRPRVDVHAASPLPRRGGVRSRRSRAPLRCLLHLPVHLRIRTPGGHEVQGLSTAALHRQAHGGFGRSAGLPQSPPHPTAPAQILGNRWASSTASRDTGGRSRWSARSRGRTPGPRPSSTVGRRPGDLQLPASPLHRRVDLVAGCRRTHHGVGGGARPRARSSLCPRWPGRRDHLPRDCCRGVVIVARVYSSTRHRQWRVLRTRIHRVLVTIRSRSAARFSSQGRCVRDAPGTSRPRLSPTATASREPAPARDALPSRVAGLSVATRAGPQAAGVTARRAGCGGLDELDHRRPARPPTRTACREAALARADAVPRQPACRSQPEPSPQPAGTSAPRRLRGLDKLDHRRPARPPARTASRGSSASPSGRRPA